MKASNTGLYVILYYLNLILIHIHGVLLLTLRLAYFDLTQNLNACEKKI